MHDDDDDNGSAVLRAQLVHMTRNELLILKADLEFSIAEIKLQIRTASDNPSFAGADDTEVKNWTHRARKALIHKRHEANQIVVELSKRKEERKAANLKNDRDNDNPEKYEAFVEEAYRTLDRNTFDNIMKRAKAVE